MGWTLEAPAKVGRSVPDRRAVRPAKGFPFSSNTEAVQAVRDGPPYLFHRIVFME
jgi:hypothetical protein